MLKDDKLSPVEWNVSQWRSKTVSDCLNSSGTGHTCKLLHIDTVNNFLDPLINEIVNRADVLVVQRNIFHPGAWDMIDYYRGLGKAVVADLDDDYPHLPISNPAHRFWIENVHHLKPEPIEGLRIGLSKCDGLTSPSHVILDDWQDTVPGYYLPNFASGLWWSDLPDRDEERRKAGLEGRVIIGWGGSVSHYDSWWGSGIREAATELCKLRPRVIWKICGNDLRLWEQLPVPNENKLLQRGVPPEEWPKVVATFDVGVAPLYGWYDQRRSWIKGMEYMLGAVPWIGTTGAPYAAMREQGMLIENGAQNWLKALLEMVDTLPAQQARAKELQPWAYAQYTMEHKVGYTIQLYEKILQRRRAIPALPGVAWVNYDAAAKAEAERAMR